MQMSNASKNVWKSALLSIASNSKNATLEIYEENYNNTFEMHCRADAKIYIK
jgi:hypothetical protein